MSDVHREGGATPSRAETLRQEARDFVRVGTTVGLVGLGSSVLLGVTCPLCVVATPVLVGLGLVRHVQARRARQP
jgi:hypothetical protein